MDYDPNVDAARYFALSILPLILKENTSACFHIVGKDPAREVRALQDDASCVIHGAVPDVTPYFDSASVFVAPIRQGSGTRLKVLEALARGKAVVATSTGAEGLDLRPGVDLEIADAPDAFARACIRLLADPPARERLGNSGRQRVMDLYRWEKIGAMAERVLLATPNAVLANGPPSATETYG
jgi:glycosyltransferase involved in cell wall biosynthesis